MPQTNEAADIVKKAPSMSSAVFAINTAGNILEIAKKNYNDKRYGDTFKDSKDVIRMASSALLFRDGYIASTLEANIRYLSKRYPGRFPIDEWRHMETVITGDGPGLLNIIVRFLGKGQRTGEKEASSALSTAERFLDCAKKLVVLRQ